MTKKGGMLISVISASLVLLLLVGIVGFLYKYTNGFNENFKSVYVECDGKMLSSSGTGETFKPKAYRFNVKSAVGIGSTTPIEYSVKIIPSKNIDFDFSVNGESHKWHDIADISEAFDIEIEENYFTIDFSSYTDMQRVFLTLYKNSDITLPEGLDVGRYCFALNVSTTDGIICNVNFRCFEPITDIEITDIENILL